MDYQNNFDQQQQQQFQASFLAGYSSGGGGENNFNRSTTNTKKPMGLRGSQSARILRGDQQRFFASQNQQMQNNKNFFDEKDLLRQRMQRLGFKTSAEALAGDSELVSR